mgnify:CR=1 FL=1
MGFNKSDIEAIKSKITIADYVKDVIVPEMPWYYSDYTVDFNLKLYIKCPIHGEDTPSFRYYPESNTFYCFGCGAGGDVINLHKAFYKSLSDRDISTEDALSFLKNKFIAKLQSKNTDGLKNRILPKGKVLSSSKDLSKLERVYRDLDNTLRVEYSLSDDIKNKIFDAIDNAISLVELEKISALDAITYIKQSYKEALKLI